MTNIEYAKVQLKNKLIDINTMSNKLMYCNDYARCQSLKEAIEWIAKDAQKLVDAIDEYNLRLKQLEESEQKIISLTF